MSRRLPTWWVVLIEFSAPRECSKSSSRSVRSPLLLSHSRIISAASQRSRELVEAINRSLLSSSRLTSQLSTFKTYQCRTSQSLPTIPAPRFRPKRNINLSCRQRSTSCAPNTTITPRCQLRAIMSASLTFVRVIRRRMPFPRTRPSRRRRAGRRTREPLNRSNLHLGRMATCRTCVKTPSTHT